MWTCFYTGAVGDICFISPAAWLAITLIGITSGLILALLSDIHKIKARGIILDSFIIVGFSILLIVSRPSSIDINSAIFGIFLLLIWLILLQSISAFLEVRIKKMLSRT